MNSTKVNGKLEMCPYSTYIMNTNEWSCCSKCFSIPQNSLIKKNPNYIGLSVIEFTDDVNFKIIHK